MNTRWPILVDEADLREALEVLHGLCGQTGDPPLWYVNLGASLFGGTAARAVPIAYRPGEPGPAEARRAADALYRAVRRFVHDPDGVSGLRAAADAYEPFVNGTVIRPGAPLSTRRRRNG